MFEYLLRTYVIETAQPTNDADSFVGLIQTVKARHDFPELEHLRIRNGVIQVQHGTAWIELGAPIPAGGAADDDEAPARPRAAAPAAAEPRRAAAAPVERADNREEDNRGAARKEQGPPPKVATSKRFRKLEMD
jgi:hypothetical protein